MIAYVIEKGKKKYRNLEQTTVKRLYIPSKIGQTNFLLVCDFSNQHFFFFFFFLLSDAYMSLLRLRTVTLISSNMAKI